MNKITAKLKSLLSIDRNDGAQTYLKNLDTTADTDYSLWKITKKLKRPIYHQPPICKPDKTWVKSNADKVVAFANHLERVFTPNPNLGSQKNEEVCDLLTTSQVHQLDLPIKKFSKNEVYTTIQKLNSRKARILQVTTSLRR